MRIVEGSQRRVLTTAVLDTPDDSNGAESDDKQTASWCLINVILKFNTTFSNDPIKKSATIGERDQYLGVPVI